MRTAVLFLLFTVFGPAGAESNPFVMWQTEATDTKGRKIEDAKTTGRIAQEARGIANASLVISAFAFILSVMQFFYQRSKDKADRRLSVEDDFWFRGVLVPATIEPLIEHVQKTCSSLPQRAALTGIGIKNGYSDFSSHYQRSHSAVISQLMMLSMFDADVYFKVSQKVDEIEDIVMEHCNANSMSANGLDKQGKTIPLFDRSDAVMQISGRLTEALKMVRETHRKFS